MNDNRTIRLVEIPIGGTDGVIWNRLHEEREEICEALLKDSNEHKELLHSRMRKLDDALDRLMSGSYGNCSKCGRSIENRRLNIDPALARCLDCSDSSTDSGPGTSVDVIIESLKAFDMIMLRTHNNVYRILLLDPKTGRALVEGGEYLREPSEALLKGSATPGTEFKPGSISLGQRLELWVNEKAFLTSPIRSVSVKHNGDAESLESISAALHAERSA